MDNDYDATRDNFLVENEEGRIKMLSHFYYEGRDALVMDLLYEVDDPHERARISPYNKMGCGYDEVVDLELTH